MPAGLAANWSLSCKDRSFLSHLRPDTLVKGAIVIQSVVRAQEWRLWARRKYRPGSCVYAYAYPEKVVPKSIAHTTGASDFSCLLETSRPGGPSLWRFSPTIMALAPLKPSPVSHTKVSMYVCLTRKSVCMYVSTDVRICKCVDVMHV